MKILNYNLKCDKKSFFLYRIYISKMNLEKINNHKSINLSNRQLCDLELLLDGSFSPLEGFLNENDYNGVVENMRLSNGKLWPMPIVLTIEDNNVGKYQNENVHD